MIDRESDGLFIASILKAMAADVFPRRGGYFTRCRPASVRLTECKPPEILSQPLSTDSRFGLVEAVLAASLVQGTREPMLQPGHTHDGPDPPQGDDSADG
jgi:hypothetical protein